MFDMQQIISIGAAFMTLLFFWAAIVFMLGGTWLVWSSWLSRPALRVVQYSLTAVIIFGAGMIVLGGVAGLWDALDAVRGHHR
jgi:hypothetical protein